MFTRHFHALLVMTLTSQTRQTSHWFTWVYFTLFYSTNLFDQSVHLVRWKVLVRVLKHLIRTFWITFDPWFGFNSPLYQMKNKHYKLGILAHNSSKVRKSLSLSWRFGKTEPPGLCRFPYQLYHIRTNNGKT